MFNFHVYDTETTGLPEWKKPSNDPSQPHLVQLSGVITNSDFSIKEKYNFIIKPDGWVIPDDMAALHGITTERAMAEGIPLVTSIGHLKAKIEENPGHTISAFNSAFDNRIIRIACKRLGIPDFLEGAGVLCAMWAAYKHPFVKAAKLKDKKLATIYEHITGKKMEGAHNAENDMMATLEVLKFVMENPYEEESKPAFGKQRMDLVVDNPPGLEEKKKIKDKPPGF